MEENTLRSWKTDKSDAHQLAQTHHQNQRQQKEVQSNFYLEMRFGPFYQKKKKITRLRMDLHNCLQLTFPELEQFFSNRMTPYALTLIRLFPHPDFVLASTRTKIKNKLINETRKKISAIVPSKGRSNHPLHSVPIQLLKKTVFTVKKRSITPNFSKIYSNKKKSTGDTNDQKMKPLLFAFVV